MTATKALTEVRSRTLRDDQRPFVQWLRFRFAKAFVYRSSLLSASTL